MDGSKSMVSDQYDDNTMSKFVPQRDACITRQTNVRLIQDVQLIWLDSKVNEDDPVYRDILTQLHQVVYSIKTYASEDKCIQFLQTVEHEKVCLVISDSFAEHVVPQVHNMPQVYTIIILGQKR